MIDQPYQLQLRQLRMGRDSDWRWAGPIEGLGIVGMRTSDSPRPLDHGEFPAMDLLPARTVTADVLTVAHDPAQLQTSVDQLVGTFAPSSDVETLSVSLPDGQVRVLFGRPRRCEVDYGRAPSGLVRAVWQFTAHDPRWYSDIEHTVSLSPPVASAGRGYPRTYPLTYGGGTSGIATADNVGNFGTRPTWTLYGPLSGPRLENVTTGRTLQLAIDLAVGDLLVVDFDNRTVLLGGTANRYSTMTSGAEGWWELVPGGNEVRLGATAGTGTAEMTFRDAWL